MSGASGLAATACSSVLPAALPHDRSRIFTNIVIGLKSAPVAKGLSRTRSWFARCRASKCSAPASCYIDAAAGEMWSKAVGAALIPMASIGLEIDNGVAVGVGVRDMDDLRAWPATAIVLLSENTEAEALPAARRAAFVHWRQQED
jgi:hypothetical protein